MQRSDFLRLCAALPLGLCACAQTDEPVIPDYVLTYADNQPLDYPTTQGALWFADQVAERTGGKVIVQVKYGGEFGTEQEVLDQMRIGGIDFARVSLSSISDDLPALNVLQLPFLYDNAQHMWRILDGEIGQHFLQLFAESSLLGLSWYDAGARCFYTDVAAIASHPDLRGMTVRVQDSQMMLDMVELLGGVPVTLPYSEVYAAFETGKIDAAENSWPSYEQQKHYEVAKFFCVTEHARVPEVQLASPLTWAALPEEYRAILAACALESAEYERKLWSAQVVASRRTAMANGAREVTLMPDAIQRFRDAVQPLYQTYCADYMDLIARIRQG